MMLKFKNSALQSEIKYLEKEIKGLKNDHCNSRKILEIKNEITKLETSKQLYVSGVEPIKFENGFVVNGKLLRQYVKKLPTGYVKASFVEEVGLVIEHKNGEISLLNLSDFYTDFKIPKGEELLVELGIGFR